jgi:AraC family transcriptional regulator
VRRNAALASPASVVEVPESERTIAAGSGWRLVGVPCRAGPRSRPFEEQHERSSISLVLSGAFTYCSGRGRALLAPGMLLLGNCGEAFTCSHDHGTGDHCLSLQYELGFFERLTAELPGTPRFQRPTLPPLRRLAPLVAGLRALWLRPALSALAVDEIVVAAPSLALAALSATRRAQRPPTPADERRIASATHAVEQRLAENLSLRELAAIAGVTPWHFLRLFQQVVGMTPHQWLLSRRLAAASRRLVETLDPVATIALDVGFGDISNFNAAFQRAFGATPTAHRRRLARASTVR